MAKGVGMYGKWAYPEIFPLSALIACNGKN